MNTYQFYADGKLLDTVSHDHNEAIKICRYLCSPDYRLVEVKRRGMSVCKYIWTMQGPKRSDNVGKKPFGMKRREYKSISTHTETVLGFAKINGHVVRQIGEQKVIVYK